MPEQDVNETMTSETSSQTGSSPSMKKAAVMEETPTRVVLVGAGPGPSWLLTLAGVDALNAADEVIVTSPDIDLSHPEVHLRQTSRLDWDHINPADFHGRQVAIAVWGDPLMDSRAADLAGACVDLGLEVDIVPGVAARTSLPEFAGISLGSTVQLVDLVATQDAELAETGPVVMIGDADHLSVAAGLAERAGRHEDEPVLVTVHAASPEQTSRSTTLGELSELARELAGTPGPVVVALGAAASPDRRNRLNWFESKPLFGWRVLVPRTKDQAGVLTSRLASHGAVPEVVPTISIEPPRTPQHFDRAITGLVEGRYRWVAFTSANAVRAVREKFTDYGLDARSFGGIQIAAVGAMTAQALRAWGLEPDLVPLGEQSAAGLSAEFPAFDELLDPMNRVLLPKADIATEVLAAGMVELGWEVEEVVAYRTVRAAPPPAETREAIKTGRFDAVVFTSSSTVRNLVGIAGKPHKLSIIAAIGPRTAETCEEHGLRVDVQAENPSAVELADALAAFALRRRAELAAKGKPTVRPTLQRRRGRPVGS